jgi:hypothetical protein
LNESPATGPLESSKYLGKCYVLRFPIKRRFFNKREALVVQGRLRPTSRRRRWSVS